MQARSDSNEPSDVPRFRILPMPDDANLPAWFIPAFHYLNVDLGENYVTLVKRWVAFERANGWKNPRSGLMTHGRPKVVTTWLQNARYERKGGEPKLTGDSLVTFTKDFRNWWVNLQPTWRPVTEGSQLRSVDNFGDDWKSLDKCGKNGWLLLIASLKWWGVALNSEDGERRQQLHDEWTRVLEDISLMLGGLIEYRSKV